MWRDEATLLDILRAAHLALKFRGSLAMGAGGMSEASDQSPGRANSPSLPDCGRSSDD